MIATLIGTNVRDGYYKTLSVQNILASIQSLFPSARIEGDYITFTDAISGHQAGDEYAIRVTQDAASSSSTETGSFSEGGVTYYFQPSYSAWTDTGDFAAPDNVTNEFSETNMVGRKIKFQLESGATVKSWAAGVAVTSGEMYFSDYNYYVAVSSGTTGTVQPIHHQGIVSDGAVDWEYLHSGFGTATIVSVQDAQHLTAVVDGYLPVLQLSQTSYTWRNYQWSMWGYHQVYPSQVFFFKGRLGFFCNTDGYGCWLQMSKTDNFYDFGTESYGQVLDTCAINQLVTGHEDNGINWLLSGDRLYCGSYSGEYNIFGNGGAVSPTDCIIDPVTSIGGAPVRAIRFSGLNLFVGRLSNEIYSIQYDYTTDDYAPDNIGFMSSHLIDAGIRRWEVLKNSDRNIYFNTNENTARVINYVKELKNLGYYRLNLGGEILDLASSNAGPISAMYFMVRRTNGVFLERVASDTPCYMFAEDRAVLQNLTPVAFPEFAGETVWVKDNVSGQFYETVIGPNGEFVNTNEWMDFSVGYKMLCTFHGQPMAGEKLEGLQQKSVRFIVRLNEAGAFSYGSSVDFSKVYNYNGWNTESSQQWNAAHKLITGDVQLPASFGYTVGQNKGTGPYPNDTGVALNVFADTPEPFTLLSVSNIYV